MGKENDAMVSFLEDNERFADLFNFSYFDGEQVVKPEDLMAASEVYVAKPESKDGVRIRDIKKRLRSGKELKILALESQSNVNYIMPWRCMDYDSREYGEQIRVIQKKNRKAANAGNEIVYDNVGERLCEFKRNDRLVPVYTICVYHGAEEWDGPRSLIDMMDFGADDVGTDNAECDRERWERYFADYPMRLICVNEMADYSKLQTSVKEVFRLLPYRKDKTRLYEIMRKSPEYQQVDMETAHTISVLIGVDTFMEREEKYKNGEGYNMCQALRELVEDSRMEGRAEGRESVLRELSDGMKAMVRDNLAVGLGEESIIKMLQKYFMLSAEEAKSLLKEVEEK